MGTMGTRYCPLQETQTDMGEQNLCWTYGSNFLMLFYMGWYGMYFLMGSPLFPRLAPCTECNNSAKGAPLGTGSWSCWTIIPLEKLRVSAWENAEIASKSNDQPWKQRFWEVKHTIHHNPTVLWLLWGYPIAGHTYCSFRNPRIVLLSGSMSKTADNSLGLSCQNNRSSWLDAIGSDGQSLKTRHPTKSSDSDSCNTHLCCILHDFGQTRVTITHTHTDKNDDAIDAIDNDSNHPTITTIIQP